MVQPHIANDYILMIYSSKKCLVFFKIKDTFPHSRLVFCVWITKEWQIIQQTEC